MLTRAEQRRAFAEYFMANTRNTYARQLIDSHQLQLYGTKYDKQSGVTLQSIGLCLDPLDRITQDYTRRGCFECRNPTCARPAKMTDGEIIEIVNYQLGSVHQQQMRRDAVTVEILKSLLFCCKAGWLSNCKEHSELCDQRNRGIITSCI